MIDWSSDFVEKEIIFEIEVLQVDKKIWLIEWMNDWSFDFVGKDIISEMEVLQVDKKTWLIDCLIL